MQVYLVGGAVRDEQLGLPVKERDWCVVGATPEEMKQAGYRQVGKDFPVFLHPETGEEYALARTERKTAAGYHGFEFHTDPGVTIEDDLGRRDLTINAIARDANGNLVDPHGGAADIRNRILRHVSDAFVEDPVRVLRVARFAARFASLGFVIAPETMALMRSIAASGEIDALVPDRVWKETELALVGTNSRVYFETLRQCGALGILFPEVDALFGVPQPEQWHPEVDTGLHVMMVLDQAEKLSADLEVRFAALVHDLGKGTTRQEACRVTRARAPRQGSSSGAWPSACRCRTPAATSAFSCPSTIRIAIAPSNCVRHDPQAAGTTDAFRRPQRFEQFLLACEADARGRTGLEDRNYAQTDLLRGALAAAFAVDAASIARGYEGKAIGEAIRRERLAAVERFRAGFQPPP